MPEMNPQRAMVIGVLDGVHLGHQALLARAARIQGKETVDFSDRNLHFIDNHV